MIPRVYRKRGLFASDATADIRLAKKNEKTMRNENGNENESESENDWKTEQRRNIRKATWE